MLAAVTTQRVENVAGEALRMHTDDGRFLIAGCVDLPVDQGHQIFHVFALWAGWHTGGKFALEAKNTKDTSRGGQGGFGNLLDTAVPHS